MVATFRFDDINSNSYARFPVEVINKITEFDNSNGINTKKITNSSTTYLGQKISKILVSSDDSADNLLKIYVHDGSSVSSNPIGFVSIPLESGMGSDVTKPIVSVLRSADFDPIVDLDNNGNPYLMLNVGWSLYAALDSAPGAGKIIQVYTQVDDY